MLRHAQRKYGTGVQHIEDSAKQAAKEAIVDALYIAGNLEDFDFFWSSLDIEVVVKIKSCGE